MIQLYAILDCDNKKMNNLQLPLKDMEKEISSMNLSLKVISMQETLSEQ